MVTLEVRYCKQGYCSRSLIVVARSNASLELQKLPAQAGVGVERLIRGGEGRREGMAKRKARDARVSLGVRLRCISL
jgi:hypothetical protein